MSENRIPNEEQREAIETTEGPVLIIAGPGTGKTFTLVQRVVYLIQEKHVDPNEILIATFTEKAAKELVTRITDELASRKIIVNLNEMYIGTFHSICLRILKDNLAHTRIKKNFRVLDQFDQQYTIFQNLYKFSNLPDYSEVITEKGKWKQAEKICYYINNLSEELVDHRSMQKDSDREIAVLGNILEKYYSFLEESNYLDFSSIQIEAYCLFKNDPEILEKLQTQLKYIMIDEYQDTNYIQEQLVFLFSGNRNNICVVGDDDQGLYRFRGATIRNILEFPQKFPNDVCKTIQLNKNYRSNSDIVEFYNHWMRETSGGKFKFSWENKFRFDKEIVAKEQSNLKSPAVIRVSGEDELDENWHKEILNFIQKLKKSGKLTDNNQIAFLFKSVKNDKVINLADFLEKNGINVYSPRSDMFFQRPEIMEIIGCLLLTFPKQLVFMDENKTKFFFPKLVAYYNQCIKTATEIIKNNPYLLEWIRDRGIAHDNCVKNTDYGFTGLLYQMFAFSPFKEYLDSDLKGSVTDLRPLRNIATLSQILNKYEYLHNVSVFTAGNIEKNVEKLFNLYLRLLFDGGIDEYEDDSEYAPSGCVSFLTIHQSKGMEFPIVFVGIGNSSPRKNDNPIIQKVEEKYFRRKPFEPIDQIKYFDFWRLYYTAFSRAQNLLILTCKEADGRGKQPSMYFTNPYERLIDYKNPDFDDSEFKFADVKSVNLKQTYSFTSHILLYERCSKQYKFFKELEFTPSRLGPTIFGIVVHQTIEDVHRAALRNEAETITPDNIEIWLRINYETISRRDHSYLGESQIEYAIGHVQRYVKHEESYHKDWSHIRDTEVDVGLVKDKYILEGTIDLIKGDGDSVDIVDFKSEKKPDLVNEKERIDLYQKQLQVYAHLVEERTGQNVGKMLLYYTGTEDGVPTITFQKDKASIEETINEFGEIVDQIQKKNYSNMSDSKILCENCDF
ncbi:MAG: ATP-dependent DNA helicase, partial [Massilibacteroides sp.]|nr:ATP-dependent DNA helicase [Massilibacteroides sp.]